MIQPKPCPNGDSRVLEFDFVCRSHGKHGDRKQKRGHNSRLLHQLIDSPANIKPSQVAVMLTNAQENDGNTSGVYHTDKRSNHVAHGVALGDDEAVHSNAVVAELTL